MVLIWGVPLPPWLQSPRLRCRQEQPQCRRWWPCECLCQSDRMSITCCRCRGCRLVCHIRERFATESCCGRSLQWHARRQRARSQSPFPALEPDLEEASPDCTNPIACTSCVGHRCGTIFFFSASGKQTPSVVPAENVWYTLNWHQKRRRHKGL